MAATEKQRIVSVIGGDPRSIYAARFLAKKGCICRLFYLGEQENPCLEGFGEGCCLAPYMLFEALEGASALLLPLPLSLDGQRLNAPFCSAPPLLCDLERHLPEDLPLVGGGLFRPALEKRRGPTLDLLKDEAFAAKNALPTAEGALGLALLHHKGLLAHSRCAILGYGRIAKALLPMLLSLGADCTVFARKIGARLAAEAAGARALPFEMMEQALPDLDILFNTVPDTVFLPEHCPLLKEEALFIELASKPYGTSDEARKLLASRHLFALGLPGKYAPAYAGRLIGEALLSIL